jgi:hypothetical protein
MENLRKFDWRLNIELGPFGHHAVEHFAAVLLPCAIKTGKKVLVWSGSALRAGPVFGRISG